jgi:aminoglycoside phosphotransferase (APT) family kinase protein
MATGAVRDPEVLRSGLERWLCERRPERTGLTIVSFERASAGFSNETVLLTVRWDDAHPDEERLVVRLPAIEPMHPHCDLAVEAATHAVLARAGIPTPAPADVELDVDFVGVEFLVMPFVEGQVGPQTPSIDPWLLGLPPDRQQMVSDGFVDLLADVHRVELEDTGLLPVLHGAGRTTADEVDWWWEYLTWAADDEPPPPIVAELLAWCATNAPRSEPEPSLLWGDARIGNAIFGPDLAVAAALDWDMAFIGPAEHDLGWFLGLDDLASSLIGRRVPGFPDREAVIARYEQRLGRTVVDLGWYEIFALVRSVAVAFRLHRLATAAGRDEVMPPPDWSPVVPYVADLIARRG